jgi:hypothetical protein
MCAICWATLTPVVRLNCRSFCLDPTLAVHVFEDSCEALGAELHGMNAGTILCTFGYFWSSNPPCATKVICWLNGTLARLVSGLQP